MTNGNALRVANVDPARQGLRRNIFYCGKQMLWPQPTSLALGVVGLPLIIRIIQQAPSGAYVAALGVCKDALNLCQGGSDVDCIRCVEKVEERDYDVMTVLLIISVVGAPLLLETCLQLIAKAAPKLVLVPILAMRPTTGRLQTPIVAANACLGGVLGDRQVAMIENDDQLPDNVIALPLIMLAFKVWVTVDFLCPEFAVATRCRANVVWNRTIRQSIWVYSIQFALYAILEPAIQPPAKHDGLPN